MLTREEINVDLPQDFTNTIIDIIQNKDPAKEYVEETSDFDVLEVQSSKEEIVPLKIKNNCKKSGKEIQNGIPNTQYKMKELKSYNQQRNEKEENVDSEEDSSIQNEEISTNKDKQKNISHQFQMLKEYFEDFFTKLAKKVQNHTNSKFHELIQRIEELEDKAGQRYLKNKKKYKFHHDEQFDMNNQRKKRHKYIKTWLKLEYVNKIQKQLMSIRQVSRQLKIKQCIIESWVANKDKLVATVNQSKGKKIYKDQLDADMLDIE